MVRIHIQAQEKVIQIFFIKIARIILLNNPLLKRRVPLLVRRVEL